MAEARAWGYRRIYVWSGVWFGGEYTLSRELFGTLGLEFGVIVVTSTDAWKVIAYISKGMCVRKRRPGGCLVPEVHYIPYHQK